MISIEAGWNLESPSNNITTRESLKKMCYYSVGGEDMITIDAFRGVKGGHAHMPDA